MSTSTSTGTRQRTAPAAPRRPRPQAFRPPRGAIPWAAALSSGVAALLAGAPLSAIVQGYTWLGQAAAVAGVVVGIGLALHRAGPAAVVLGQCAGVLLMVTAEFAVGAVLGVLPGPAAFRSFGTLFAAASAQIAIGIAPVPATPEILFLITAAFGSVVVAVYLAAVLAKAPAAAGVPLLAVFAVPAALDDDLLPWGTVVCAAAGFGVLLIARDGARRQRAGGVVVVAAAIAVALGIGAAGGFVGTAGRFAGGGAGGGGSIGLSPFTSLRGQLTRSDPEDLFHMRGLPAPAYLRALTLSTYVDDVGWQPTRPGNGPTLPGTLGVVAGAGVRVADIDVENVGFKDYWLPLYGSPVSVTGLQGRFTFDERSGTAYSTRPRAEESWVQRAAFGAPTAAQLRAAENRTEPVADYLDTRGVDRRVVDLARQVTAGATTAFDKAMALQEFFTGPASQFHYSLQTAPGNGDDALVEFLTVGKSGYCEQFSAAMAVMLRAVGVPTRVAVGFTGGTTSGDHVTVSTSDAHAWVEVWFSGYGWLTFDPTPLTDGRTIVPPYVAQAEAESTGPGTAAAPARDPAADARPQQADPTTPTPEPTVADSAAPPTGDSGFPLLPVALGAAVALLIAALLLPAVLRSRERRQRYAAVADGGPDAASAAWAELLADSEDRGVPPRTTDTVRGAARRLAREHRLDEAARQHLRQLVGAVEASWYGGSHPERGELDESLASVLAAVAQSTPGSRRSRLLPRSLRHRSWRPRRPPKAAGLRPSARVVNEPENSTAAPAVRGGGDGESGAIPARSDGGSVLPSDQ